jgi:L-asparaginase
MPVLRKDSLDLTDADRAEVRAQIASRPERRVVVTHGTDSIEETAFLLDLWHDRPAPVIVTGAMRTRDSPGWDGDLNLIDACRVAVAEEARDRGVLVVMNRRIHAAGEVTKAVTDALDPLVSQPSGALGQLVDDRVDLFRPPLHRHRLPAPDAGSAAVLPWVELLTAHPDTDPRLVPALVQAGCRGLVVRAMGRGNVSPGLAQALTEAAGSGLPVVLVSRCAAGEPGADYGYVGGGAELIEAGIVSSPRLNDLKARLALAWLLHADAGDDQIRGFFAGTSR